MILVRAASICSVLALVVVSPAVAAGKVRPSPSGPTNLRITATTATSVSLAWDAAKSGSTNWWYCVQHNGSGCVRVDPPQTTLTRGSLLPGQTHTFSVYAIDTAGQRSADSNTVSYTTPADTTPPSPPPTLSLVAAYPTRISIAWTSATDDTSQVWYSLLVNGNPSPSGVTVQGTTLFYLSPATTYTLQVTTRDAYNNASASNVLSVTTPAVTELVPPTPPTNLRLSPESSAPEAWLNWEQSTDNADPQSLLLYEVYLNGVRNDDGVVGYGSTITYCRDVGTTEIVLRAVDTSGNRSAPSNAILFDC